MASSSVLPTRSCGTGAGVLPVETNSTRVPPSSRSSPGRRIGLEHLAGRAPVAAASRGPRSRTRSRPPRRAPPPRSWWRGPAPRRRGCAPRSRRRRPWCRRARTAPARRAPMASGAGADRRGPRRPGRRRGSRAGRRGATTGAGLHRRSPRLARPRGCRRGRRRAWWRRGRRRSVRSTTGVAAREGQRRRAGQVLGAGHEGDGQLAGVGAVGRVGEPGPGERPLQRARARRAPRPACRRAPSAWRWWCRRRRAPMPVTASMRTRPSEYTSALPSTGWPWACSGEAYRAVPSTAPCGSVHAASARARASPKSATRRRPSSPKRRLAGFTSRWTNPRRWA